MPFVRNMLIMKHLHHPHTEKEPKYRKGGYKNYNTPKCIPLETY